MSSEREVKFWCDTLDREHLTADSIEEALAEALDDVAVYPKIPETLTLYGFAPRTVDAPRAEREAEWALECLIERLDEDFGPLDESTEPSGDMREAAREFVVRVLRTYEVWQCEHVETRVVKVADHYTPLEASDER